MSTTEIKTFTEPGPGRKLCPGKCGLYIGARGVMCTCGWRATGYENYIPPAKKEIQVFSEAGKGRKPCPNCHKDGKTTYVGLRTTKCSVCGYDFPKVERNKPDNPPPSDETIPAARTSTLSTVDVEPDDDEPPVGKSLGQRGFLNVAVPAGTCPKKLTTTHFPAVFRWAEAVRKVGEERLEYYTLTALKYWARQSFDIYADGVIGQNPDYLTVCKNLERYESGDCPSRQELVDAGETIVEDNIEPENLE